jgi:hypothetical protein
MINNPGDPTRIGSWGLVKPKLSVSERLTDMYGAALRAMK